MLDHPDHQAGMLMLLALAVIVAGGVILIDWLIDRRDQRWIDNLEARFAFQPSHLDESEAAALAHLHQQHLQHNDHQPVA